MSRKTTKKRIWSIKGLHYWQRRHKELRSCLFHKSKASVHKFYSFREQDLTYNCWSVASFQRTWFLSMQIQFLSSVSIKFPIQFLSNVSIEFPIQFISNVSIEFPIQFLKSASIKFTNQVISNIGAEIRLNQTSYARRIAKSTSNFITKEINKCIYNSFTYKYWLNKFLSWKELCDILWYQRNKEGALTECFYHLNRGNCSHASVKNRSRFQKKEVGRQPNLLREQFFWRAKEGLTAVRCTEGISPRAGITCKLTSWIVGVKSRLCR